MGHSLLHDYILGGEITLSSSNMISKIVPLTDIVVRHNILKCWLNAFNYTNRKLLQMRTNIFLNGCLIFTLENLSKQIYLSRWFIGFLFSILSLVMLKKSFDHLLG